MVVVVVVVVLLLLVVGREGPMGDNGIGGAEGTYHTVYGMARGG